MTGNKRRAPGSKSTASSMTIVEKLKILRSLNCGFSESDLSNCLRQSGYRVDVAAERLVTGEYRPMKKSSNNNQLYHRGARATTTERAISSSNNTNANARQAAAAFQQHRYSSSTPPPSNIAPGTKDHLTPCAQKKAKHTSGMLTSSSSILVTPKTTSAHKKTKDGEIIETDNWLLCQRWVSDAVNLQRGGACDYLEEFHVLVEQLSSQTASSSFNAPKALRFRSGSRRMDGSFPRHLSFLGPLLRNHLIRVKATALMEEQRLPIGAQVAFSLSVWLVDPIKFFAVFDDSSIRNSHAPSYSKQFFATVAAKTNANNKNWRGPANGSSLKSCRDAAFSMLQWAQYGKLPSSPRPETCADNQNDNNHNHDEEKYGEESVELNNENDEIDIDTQTSAVSISAKEEDAAIPHWAREVLVGNNGHNDEKKGDVESVGEGGDCDTSEKEMVTPLGFREGIQLRPYQKQSLYLMTQREKIFGSGRNQLLHLLHELSNESFKTANMGSKEDHEVCVLGSRKEISCDCGPVLVDTNRVDAQSVSKALAVGNLDYDKCHSKEQELNHPLWERRFLCNEKRTKALSFYVQPSFRNAAAEPPPPPLPCRGGILADSMG